MHVSIGFGMHALGLLQNSFRFTMRAGDTVLTQKKWIQKWFTCRQNGRQSACLQHDRHHTQAKICNQRKKKHQQTAGCKSTKCSRVMQENYLPWTDACMRSRTRAKRVMKSQEFMMVLHLMFQPWKAIVAI